jgi:hypothetical protein
MSKKSNFKYLRTEGLCSMLHSEQASEEAIVALIKLINVAAARSASLAPNIKTESKDQEKIRT